MMGNLNTLSNRRKQALRARLEDRILMDAVPDAPIGDLTSSPHELEPLPEQQQVERLEQTESRSEIVFVDAAVNDADTLLDGLLESNPNTSFELHLLDGNSDGLAEIAAMLEGRSGLDAIHILSHGDQAVLRLGGATITGDQLTTDYADELAVIGSALSADADILIYGCDLAGSAEGEHFVDSFSKLTGADVAASDDPTGHASLGGDWDLEVAVGQITAQVLAAPEWMGLLDAPQVDLNGNDGTTAGSFRDEFTTTSYSRQDGDPGFDWKTNWIESGDDNDPGNGDIEVIDDAGDNRLRFRDAGPSIKRSVDLTDFASATLKFDYRREGLSSSSDYVRIEASSDGATFTEIGRIAGTTNDNTYQMFTADISSYRGANTTIRFTAVGINGSDDEEVFIDNVDIEATVAPPTDFTTTFNIGAGPIAIAETAGLGTEITDATSLQLSEATIRLVTPQTGDSLSVAGTLPTGITSTISGDGYTVTLAGAASLADYETAILQIRFDNSETTPSAIPRTVTVSVKDESANQSNMALTTIDIAYPPVAEDNTYGVNNAETVSGNVINDDTGQGMDNDGDGSPLSVVEVNGVVADVGQQITLASGALLTLNADGTFLYDPNGAFDALPPSSLLPDSFNYTISDGTGTDSATVTINVNTFEKPLLDLDANDFPVPNEFAHNFETTDYSVNDGNAGFDFAGPWVELTDGGSPTGGNILITADGSENVLRLSGANNSIERAVDLTSHASATLTFDYRRAGFDSGDTVIVEVDDGTGFVTVLTIDATTSTDADYQQVSVDLTAYRSANTTIRLTTSAGISTSDFLYVDNFRILVPGTVPPTNFEINFEIGGGPVRIAEAAALGTSITDPDSTMMSRAVARITNPSDGDFLSVEGALPAGITATISADGLTVSLVGDASVADYEIAIEQLRYGSNSTVLSLEQRIIEIQVADDTGLLSDTAETRVNFLHACAPVDLWFGNDESGSVDANEFLQSRVLMAEVALRLGFGPSAANAALYTWSNAASQASELTLTGDRDQFVEDVLNYDRNFSGGTSISSAINFGVGLIQAGGRAGVPQALVILTDALPSQITNDESGIIAESNAAKALGIEVVFVAIQEAQQDPVAYQILVDNASTNANGDALIVRAETYAGISEIEINALAAALCPSPAPLINLDPDNSEGGADDGDYETTYVEDGVAVSITDADVDISDASDADMASLTLTVGGMLDGAAEVLTIGGVDIPLNASTIQTVTVGTTTFSVDYDASTGTFAITEDGGGRMLVSDIEALLAGTTYRNDSQDPTFGDRTIDFQVSDGTYGSNVVTSTIAVQPTNDAPVAANDSLLVPVDAVDYSVQATLPTDAEQDDATLSISVTQVPDISEGTLTIGAGGTVVTAGMSLTPAELDQLVFTPVPAYSGPVTDFTYTVSDAFGATADGSVTFGFAPGTPPVAADDSVVIPEDATDIPLNVTPPTDNETADASLVVTVDQVPGPSQGTLTIGPGGPVVSASDTLTPAELALLVFTPAPNYDGLVDDFEYTVTDGDGLTDPGSVSITITPENDPPAVDLNGVNELGNGFANTYDQGGAAVSIADTDANLDDIDDMALSEMTFAIGGVVDGDSEVLTIGGTDFPLGTSSTQTIVVGGTTFAVSYDSATGEFTISNDAGGDMPLADMELLLTGTTYRNDSLSPTSGDRTIDVQTTDADAEVSNLGTSTISVNVAPLVDLNGVTPGEDYTTSFSSGDTPVSISDSATLTDVDHSELSEMAFTVGGVLDGGSEIISIGGGSFPLDTDSLQTVTVGTVTFNIVYNSSTGEFTITNDAGGNVPTADMEALLATVTYENTAGTTTTGDRSIDVQVTDPNGVTSNGGVATVSVLPPNDPPVIDLNGIDDTGNDFAATYTEGTSPVGITDTDVAITDDETELSTLTIMPGGIVDGGDEVLTFNGDVATSISIAMDGTPSSQQITVNGITFDVVYDGTNITVSNSAGGDMPITDLQSLLAATQYDNTSVLPTEGDRTFEIQVNDGDIDSNLTTSTISVVRDAENAEWSIGSTTTSVAEGNNATWDIDLSGALRAGEDASVVINLSDGTTGITAADLGVPADVNQDDLYAAINAAVALRADLTFDDMTGTLTFTSQSDGDTMETLSINLPVVDDSLIEGDETLTLSLSSASSTTGSNATVGATDDSVDTTITDNDGPGEWSITGPTDSDEGSTPQYTVGLSGTYGAGEVVTVDLALTDIDTNSSDYGDLLVAIQAAADTNPAVTFDALTGTLTYTAPADGATMTPLVIDLALTDDGLIEGPEEFSLGLSNATSSTGANVGVDAAATTVTTTINDTQGDGGVADGPGDWSISGPTDSDEGSTPQYTVALSGTYGAGEVVTVDLGLTDIDTSSSDYDDWLVAIQAAADTNPDVLFDALTGTLTYTASADGATMTPLVVNLPLTDDGLIEGPEDFVLDLTNATTSTGANVGVDAAAATVTTTINDTQGDGGVADGPGEWSITGPTDSDEGSTPQYTVALSGTYGAGEVVTVDLGLTDIDTNSSDYAGIVAAATAAATANPDVTFDPLTGTLTYTSPSDGATMTPLVIDLLLVDDALVEGPEDFSLGLSNATSSTGANVGVDATAGMITTTINDTAGPGGAADSPIQWSVTGDVAVDEGGTSGYIVAMDRALGAGQTATIDLALSDVDTASTDYADFVAAVNAAVAAYNAGSDPGTLAFDGTTLTFTATADGDSMADLSIDLGIVDDTLIEGPEDFNITLTNPASTTGANVTVDLGAASVTTTVSDTVGDGGQFESVQWNVTGDNTVLEGGSASYSLSLDGLMQSGETAVVTLGITNIGTTSADYEAIATAVNDAILAYTGSGAYTYNAGTGELTFTSDGNAADPLVIGLDALVDATVEGPENYEFTLSVPSSTTGADVTVDPANDTVVTTILGDDLDAIWQINGDVSVDEGGTANYSVTMVNALQAGEVVSVEMGLSNLEASGADYANFNTAVINAVAAYNAGANPGSLTWDGTTLEFTSDGTGTMGALVFSMAIVDDTSIEGPERYSIVLANPASTTGSGTSIDPGADDVLTTIRDTVGDGGALEVATWSIGVDQTISEGDAAAYTISLSGDLQSGEVAEVDISLGDVTTTVADYDDFSTAVTAAVASYNAGVNPGSLTWDGTTLSFTSDGTGSMADIALSLGTVDDVVAEGVEDYLIVLGNPASPTGIAVDTSVVSDNVITTIDDTTGPGINDVQWSITGDDNVDEGNNASYTISMAAGSIPGPGEDMSITIGLTDLETDSGDYGALMTAVNNAVLAYTGPGMLTFNTGTGVLTYANTETFPAQMDDLSFSLGSIDDAISEGVERYDIQLTAPSSTSGLTVITEAGQAQIVTTINDNDTLQWQITGDATLDEGETASYTVDLAGTLQAGETAIVQLGFADIDTDSADYLDFIAAVNTAIGVRTDVVFDSDTGILTFTGDGNAFTALNIDLGTNNDNFVEGPELLRVELSNASSTTGALVEVDATNGAVVTTIRDTISIGGALEEATWSITGDPTVDEGGSATYIVDLAGVMQVAETASVFLSLADVDTNSNDHEAFLAAVDDALIASGRTDLSFNSITGELTFTSTGIAMPSFAFTLDATNDNLLEGPEDYRVAISIPNSSTGASVQLDGANFEVATEIQDTQSDGGPSEGPGEWTITGDSSIDEGESATYTVALSGAYGAGEVVSVELDLAVIDTNSSDYGDILAAIQAAADANLNVTFDGVNTLTYTSPTDGATMTDLSITLPITDDAYTEGSEDFSLTLTNAASTTEAPIAVGTASSVTTTIDDTQGPSGTADGPSEWSITGPAAGDEGATIQFTIGLTGTFGENEVATVDIALNDIDTNSSDYADYVAAINAAVAAYTGPGSVAFDGTTLTYTAGADGEAMADLVINLPLTDDGRIEGPEDFSLDLTNAGSLTGANVGIDATADTVSTTINDTQGVGGPADGPAEWSIIGPNDSDEGSTPQYTVALSGTFGAGEVVTVDLGLTEVDTNSSDYADLLAAIQAAADANPDVLFDPLTGTLTYTAPSDGAAMSPLIIDLPLLDDGLIEGPEDFSLDLFNATSSTGANVGVDATADMVTTTINDTQGDGGVADGPGEWSLTGPTDSDEGSSSQYTVALSGAYGGGEVVTVDLGLTDIDTNSSDYGDLLFAIQAAADTNPDVIFDPLTGKLTYTAPADGATMAPLVIDLTLLDDGLIEGPEDFSLSLTNATSSTDATVAVDAAADTVTTTINDTQGDGGVPDGPAEWSITGPSTQSEGTTADYTISLSGAYQAGEVISVDLDLIDINTTSGDYGDLVAAATAADAANPDVTFDALTGTFTYIAPTDGASMTSLVISLPITDDGLLESPETFSLGLSNDVSTTGVTPTISASAGDVTTTINGAPVAEDDVNVANFDTPVDGSVLTNDFDPDGDPLTVTLVNGTPIGMPIATAGGGTVEMNPDGTYTYTPDPTFVGTDTFTYEVCDSLGNCETATVTIEVRDSVTDPNSTPIASDDNLETFADAPITSNLLGNDGDPDGDALIVNTTPVTDPVNGTVVINPDGTFTYTPNAAFVGTDTFEYEVCDASGACDTAIVTVTITADPDPLANHAPDANDDLAVTQLNTTFTGSALTNDTDPDPADILTVTDVDGTPIPPGGSTTITTPNGGTLEIADDGTYTYTPADGFVGTETIEYTIDDGLGGTDTATIYLSVFDSAPQVEDDINNTALNTPVDGNVLTNDQSDPNDTLAIGDGSGNPITGPTSMATDNGGTLVINPDGTYSYTPATDFVGEDSITLEICDEQGNCVESVLTIEARDSETGGNTPPIATNDTASGLVDQPVTGSLTSNDGDPDGDVITINQTPTIAPSNGTVTINPDGTYIYTPDPGFSGTDSFEYEICDAGGACDTATVTIDIAPDSNGLANDPPAANDDAGIGQKNTPINGDLLANDSDPNGDPLTINPTPISGPTNGTLTINPDGTYEYTPNDDFVGNDSFTYEVCDDTGACDSATVYLTVFDNPPVAQNDINNTLVDTPVTGNVLTNDGDPNPNDDLTVSTTPVTGPSHGTLTLNPDGTYEYAPDSGFVGIDSFEYEVCDEGGNCTTATVGIEVRDTATIPNDPPIAVDDTTSTFTDTRVVGNVLGNDSDPNGDKLTVNTTPVSGPTNGMVTLNPDGSFTYTPVPGFTGTDSFEYEVCDENGDCSTAVATIEVADDPTPGVNDPPIANDDAGTGELNSPITGDLLGNDSDPNGDPLTVNQTPVTPPTNGTLVINPDGTYTYTPNSGFVGTDSFEYEVCDDSGACSTASVSLEVVDNPAPNAPPIVNDETTMTFNDQPVSGSLTSNDGDPEGGPITINTTPISGPSNGSITINPDGSYTYTPNAGFTGTDTVEYEVCDDIGNCDTGVLTIEVAPDANGPANDAPFGGDDAGIGRLNEPIVGDLLANDTDPNGDPLAINTTPLRGPTNGTLVINPDGTYEYTPDPDFMGPDSFEYEVCDSNGECDIATVQLTVFSQPPVAENDLLNTTKDTPVSGNVLINDSDPDTDDDLTVTTSPVTPPANGTVTLNADGTFTYTPNAGFAGVDLFEYEVCDDAGVCSTATVTIAIADIAVAKEQISVVPNADNFDVTFQLVVENTGGTRMDELSLVEDLSSEFGAAFVSVTPPIVDATNVASGVAPTLNAAWTGDTSLDMFDPSVTNEHLLPNESFTITFMVTVDPDATGTSTALDNQVEITAVDKTTDPTKPLTVTDLSDSGNTPSSTGEGEPGSTPSGEDDPTPIQIPDLRTAKDQTGATRLTDGTWELDFALTLENTGTVTMTNLSLVDDLASQFGNAWLSTSNVLLDTGGVAGGIAPGLNGAWVGDSTQDIFDGTGQLLPGEFITVNFTVNVDPDADGLSTPLASQAVAMEWVSVWMNSVIR